MQKRGKRLFFSLLASVGVLVILIGILFGNTLLAHKTGAHAANPTSGNPQKMQTTLNPMFPMKTMGVQMGTGTTTAAGHPPLSILPRPSGKECGDLERWAP